MMEGSSPPVSLCVHWVTARVLASTEKASPATRADDRLRPIAPQGAMSMEAPML
ncbi:hypothetical protein D3C87_1443750 [compost metagenome]